MDQLSADVNVGRRGPSPVIGTTTFDYLIDATGRAGIMSTKYLKNRHFNVSLKNVAIWGYWNNVDSYGVGTNRQGAPWFEALTGKILHCYCTNVGIS
jgi:flavine halogenase